MFIFLFRQSWKKTSNHGIQFYQAVNKCLSEGTAWCWYLSQKRQGSEGENVKIYANKSKIRLEASRWLSHSLTRNQSCGATSCREKVGGGGDHYLGFRESSFVWHLPLKTPGSKKTAANSSKLWENEVAWLLTQCLLTSISLCLRAGRWRCIEWEGSCCLLILEWAGQVLLSPCNKHQSMHRLNSESRLNGFLRR